MPWHVRTKPRRWRDALGVCEGPSRGEIMKSRTVTMHYCEFCKRKGQRSKLVAKHEAECFFNPERVCRLCADDQLEQKPLAELITTYRELGGAALATMAEGCPACINATVVQTWRDVDALDPSYVRTVGSLIDDKANWTFDYKSAAEKWAKDFRGKYHDDQYHQSYVE